MPDFKRDATQIVSNLLTRMARAVQFGKMEQMTKGGGQLETELRGWARWRHSSALTLGLLTAIYTSNFIDRSIVAILGQAIKVDLQLSDTQLGLLQGLAFVIFYTALGIPLARLSERVRRVTLISICLTIWSGMTALCGAAQSYAQLFLFRIGVGIGEAGCSPPAHSIISDLYPPKSRATALAIYSFGIPLGTMLGAICGGWLTQNFSWRVAMVVVGLPGVLLAIIFQLLTPEPARGMRDQEAATSDIPSIGETARRLFGDSAFRHITIGASLVGFVGYGTGTFAPAYFIRMFNLSYAEIGFAFGLIGGLSAGLGTILGGAASDWAGRKNPHWYATLPALGLLIAAPAYMAVFMRSEWIASIWLMIVPGIFHYAYIGPTLGTMHNLAAARMRATATALFFVVVNLIGLGLGPFVTGLLIDLASERRFAALGFGEFIVTCPGGVAPPGSPLNLVQACHQAIALGTRDAIVLVLFVFFWAATHYLIAAWRMKQRAGAGSPALTGIGTAG